MDKEGPGRLSPAPLFCSIDTNCWIGPWGTHASLFMPLIALARVVADIDDEPAAAILGGNPAALLGV